MNVRGKRVYCAGPMTGKKKWNFPEFERAKLLIDANGGIGVSPHRIDAAVWGFHGEPDLPPQMCHDVVLPIDYAVLRTCDAIYLLPGWSKSKGARFERAAADVHGLEIMYAADAEQGGLGVLLEPTWEAAYIAELEDEVLDAIMGGWGIPKKGEEATFREGCLKPVRERASRTGVKPKE